MKDKTITVEDYEKYGKEFFDKYFILPKNLERVQKQKTFLKSWNLLQWLS